MKFQTLKKDNRKYLVLGIIIILIIVAVLCFVGTWAKYRNTQSVQVATGTINYSGADFNIIAMADQDGNELSTMPSSGYIIDEEKSYCTVNGVKDTNASLYTNSNGEHVIANLQKGSKCYLTFTKVITKDGIIADNGGASVIEAKTATFSKTSCAANTNCSSTSSCTTSCGEVTNGMYAAADDDGTSYYFRGSVDNNWVSFGGFYWRIIRINGDGTIRLIYNGTSVGATGSNAQLSSTSAYNSTYNNNMYVGYMYTSGEVHGTGTDSTIKSAVDTWYSTNLNKTGVKEYIDTNAGFCNDRVPYTNNSGTTSGGGTSTTTTYYAPYIRLYKSGSASNAAPSLKCQTSDDLFTVSGAKKTDGTTAKGNQKLSYPVGLITADEVAYAGSVFGSNNYGYWLYTGSAYWTMSPYYYNYGAVVLAVGPTGYLYNPNAGGAYGVRPVINLKADTIFSSGDGTSSNPYVVKTS